MLTIFAVLRVISGHECKLSLEYYVQLSTDLCMVCPHVARIKVHWKFTTHTDTSYAIMINDTVITSSTKYARGGNPYSIIIRNIATSDIGTYRCTSGNHDIESSQPIRVYMLKRQYVFIPTMLSCGVPISETFKWTIAAIGTPIEDEKLWKNLDSNFIVRVYTKVILQIKSSYTITSSIACRSYTSTGMLYAIMVYDVYWEHSVCDRIPPICLRGSTCTASAKDGITCKCTAFHTGSNCGEISVYVVSIYVICMSIMYVLIIIFIHIFMVSVPRRTIITCHIINTAAYACELAYVITSVTYQFD